MDAQFAAGDYLASSVVLAEEQALLSTGRFVALWRGHGRRVRVVVAVQNLMVLLSSRGRTTPGPWRALRSWCGARGTAGFSPGNAASGYVVLSLLTRLPDPFWLVSLGAFGFLVSGPEAFNRTLPRPNGVPLREPTGFNGRQLVLLVVSVAFWGMVLIGLSLPDDDSRSWGPKLALI